MNFKENISSLRTASNDYYFNRLTFDEYRKKRNELLILIDEELNGVKIINDEQSLDVSIMDKALSFLKIDKLKSTN